MNNLIKKISRSIKAAAVLAVAAFSLSLAQAQELRCTVEVNADKIEGSSKSVFESLQQAINEYMNENRFSNASYSPNERIECRMFFTVNEYDGDRIKADLQVQLSRPVYNSSYSTTLLNFRDTKVEFDYREGDPLIFNETTFDSNLTAILNYYALLFLAIDSDSFAPQGGQTYFDRVASIVQMAQSSGEVGWKAFEDTKNRSAVLNSYTDSNMAGVRKMLYDYHRKGLDEMVTSPDKGRAVITESLAEIEKVYKLSPMSVALSIFRDSKLDELVNLYSKAPEAERSRAYEILQPIYPTDSERLEKIKKGS